MVLAAHATTRERRSAPPPPRRWLPRSGARWRAKARPRRPSRGAARTTRAGGTEESDGAGERVGCRGFAIELGAPWLFGLRPIEGVPCASAHIGTITSRTSRPSAPARPSRGATRCRAFHAGSRRRGTRRRRSSRRGRRRRSLAVEPRRKRLKEPGAAAARARYARATASVFEWRQACRARRVDGARGSNSRRHAHFPDAARPAFRGRRRWTCRRRSSWRTWRP